jgi:Domain of unknown function (DUF4149)
MNTILRFLEVFALGTWLGGILYLSFAVAPGAFGTLGSRDQAGALVGLVLGRLHVFGVIAGIVYLVVAVALARSPAALSRPAALAVILMVALTAVSQWGVSPRMAALRTEMGSVDRTPVESPLRAEFDRLHRISVRLEGSVLLLGIAALFLSVREHR